VRHFFPFLRVWLDALDDGRDKEACTYPLRALMWLGLLMFLLALSARRRLRYDLNSAFGLENLNALAETVLEMFPHPDTLAYALRKLPVKELASLRTRMARSLLRGRVLERFRLRGKFYLLAVDGTGYLRFSKPHCPHCLTRRLSNGQVQYHHPVLEAKLICDNGLVISLGTEFITNGDGQDKQDCEQNAFQRLLPRLRADFPHLSLCLLLDGLYLNGPTLALLKRHHCAWIITFKEGSLPEASREFEALWSVQTPQQLATEAGKLHRRYRWVNDLSHAEHRFHALECVETPSGGEATRFRWATSLRVDRSNVEELSEKGGRQRSKIENEGFNAQKNGGYGLEHAYAQDWNAARNFYFLMQIAHLISQLLVKGTLRHTPVVEIFGSLRAFAARLLEAWRTATLAIAPAALDDLLPERRPIRLDDS
jgi:hypothetical protein